MTLSLKNQSSPRLKRAPGSAGILPVLAGILPASTKRRPPAPPREKILRAMPPLPRAVQWQLHALATRQLRLGWTEGVLWLLLAGCLLAPAQALADWLFDLPWGTRALLMLADLAIAGALIFRYGFCAWRGRLTPEQAALRAEVRWPAFRSSLISAVQLSRQPEGSPHMVQALISQVAKRAATLDFRLAINSSRVRKIAMAAGALLLLVAALTWWTAPRSLVLGRRILLGNIPLPTETIVVPVTGDFAIQPGQTIDVAAKAAGVIPRAGRVEIRYPGQPVQVISVNPRPATPDLFSLALPNLQQPFTYRFYLNDGRSAEFKVAVIHGPILESAAFQQAYPAYTGLPPETRAAGDLTLLAGSDLHIQARSSQPLASAQIVLQGIQQTVPLVVGGDGQSLTGDLPIRSQKLTGFSIHLRNADGIESQGDTLYRVEVTPDAPPVITIAPGQPQSATFVATVHPRLRFGVRDDFQVNQVFLCCGTAGETPDSADQSHLLRIPLDVPKQAAALDFDYVWDPPAGSAIWKEGASFNYWIEAVDNNNVTGPGVSRTAVRQWQVISAEAKRQELADKMRTQADALGDLSQRQEQLRAAIGDALKQENPK